MACIPCLNPPKTLRIISSSSSFSINNHISSPSRARIDFRIAQISKRLPKISIVMATKQQEHELNLNALTSSDRRDEVMTAAKSSLSNCLSETNLHLTIPALKSKTRGKQDPPFATMVPSGTFGPTGAVFAFAILK